jgi:bacterioferritin (cytochrome b1)
MNTLKHEAEQHQHRVRELEEQIQSDGRVERLENSLKNTQDRADELEFQLSKLRQVGLRNMLIDLAKCRLTGSYYPEDRA